MFYRLKSTNRYQLVYVLILFPYVASQRGVSPTSSYNSPMNIQPIMHVYMLHFLCRVLYMLLPDTSDRFTTFPAE